MERIIRWLNETAHYKMISRNNQGTRLVALRVVNSIDRLPHPRRIVSLRASVAQHSDAIGRSQAIYKTRNVNEIIVQIGKRIQDKSHWNHLHSTRNLIHIVRTAPLRLEAKLRSFDLRCFLEIEMKLIRIAQQSQVRKENAENQRKVLQSRVSQLNRSRKETHEAQIAFQSSHQFRRQSPILCRIPSKKKCIRAIHRELNLRPHLPEARRPSHNYSW